MHKFIAWLAHAMAIIGGLALTALILLTCVSILGRSGNTLAHSDWLSSSFPGLTQWLIEHGVGPVNGDFELVEAGIAFAIFAFLPICQLRGGHATVDIFTTHLPKRANQFLVTFWEVLMALAIILISWRLCIGMLDKMRYQETTFLLQFPVWWAYAASFIASLVAALVACYCAAMRALALWRGQPDTLGIEEAIH
ncbi:MAG: TRAP transporter small permease [Thiolinea sp.]